jgi:hypothetical protein
MMGYVRTWVALAAILTVWPAAGVAAVEEPVTVEGLVVGGHQIVDDDGTVWELARTPLGDAVSDLLGRIVVVEGYLVEMTSEARIVVLGYDLIE